MKSKNRTKPSLHLIEQISLNSIAAYFINKKKKAGKSRENKLWGQIGSLFASWEHELSAALFQNISGNDKVKHHCNLFLLPESWAVHKNILLRAKPETSPVRIQSSLPAPTPCRKSCLQGEPCSPTVCIAAIVLQHKWVTSVYLHDSLFFQWLFK